MEIKTQLKYKKSGFAAESVGAIVTLIVGVGVSVLVLIFVGTLGGQTYNIAEDNIVDIGNASVLNEGLTNMSDSVAYNFANTELHSGDLFMAVNGSSLNLDNFTIDYTVGTIQLVATADDGLNLSNFEANYTYGDLDIQTNIKNSIKAGFSALEQTGDYLPLIVLAVVITLVMGLVLSMGGMGGGARGGNAL